VHGYESWDGSAYARDLRAFEPLYKTKLEQMRSITQRMRGNNAYMQSCPIGWVSWAANAYVDARMIGVPEARAIAEADAMVQGVSFTACQQYIEGPVTDWRALRAKLLAFRPPPLTRERATH
jgi:hypothetical protein